MEYIPVSMRDFELSKFAIISEKYLFSNPKIGTTVTNNSEVLQNVTCKIRQTTTKQQSR